MKEKRRGKERDERKGMRGYLEISSPSLATVPNDMTQLAPFASLEFMPVFYSLCVLYMFSLCVFVFLAVFFPKSHETLRIPPR